MATLINGDGNQAVYAAQDADLLSGTITNNKTVILDVGEKFSADVLSSSVIEVHDGVILTKEGRRIQLDQNAVDLFEFPAGAQGVVSWYYMGYKLEIDEDSHQVCSTFVQKMDTEGDTIPEGSFRDGDQEVYISLYHVQQDTLGVLTPTLVLTEFMTATDILDNLIGSASDLPDPTKTVTKNIDQINSDLTTVNNRVGNSMGRSLLVSTFDISNEVTVSVNLSDYKFFNVYAIRNSAPRFRFATSLISASLLNASSANEMLYFGISSGQQWLESGHIYHENGILHALAGNSGWTFVVEGYTN